MNLRLSEKRNRLRRRGLLLAVLSCVSMISVVFAAVSNAFVCYAVTYDGEVVGTVSSRAELDSAIEEADATAAMILGEEHPVYGSLAVTTVLSSGTQSPDDVAGALLESVEGIEYRPVLTVDGETASAAESAELIDEVLEGILARYEGENTVSARIVNDLSVDSGYVNAGLVADGADLAALLDPEGDSPYALTVVTQERSVSEVTVPFEEVILYDDTAYSDESWVNQEGAEGRRLDVIITVLENGKPVTSYVSESTVLTQPVDRVVTVGTLPGSRTDSTGTYIWPTTGVITSRFGHRDIEVASTEHRGIDIGNSVGTQVVAADGGTVIYAQDSKGNYGNFIKIQHDNGTVTCYAHLSKILVSVGDKVYQGQLIAEMGKTGRVTGPHLHFEIRPNGTTPVDPAKYLSGKPARN